MPNTAQNLDTDAVLSLIEKQGTLNQASAFLRHRGLAFSAGSWSDMRALRLKPSLEDGSISHDDLLQLLALSEEHGHQHTFVYKIDNEEHLQSLFDRDLVEKRLSSSAKLPDLGTHQFVEMPDTKTVVDVRYDLEGNLLFKIVEKRIYRSNPLESIANGQVTVTYDAVPYRAVHVVRVSLDGLVDVRVFSGREAINYEVEADVILDMVTTILDKRTLVPHSLDGFRDLIWDPDRREEIAGLVTVNNSDHKNSDGSRLRASSAMIDRAIFDDESLTGSVDHFHAGANAGYCERASLTILADGSDGVLSRDVHASMLGASNEFMIGSKLTGREYEYIFRLMVASFGAD